MAISAPRTNPRNRKRCADALAKSFELLVKEASWANWDVSTAADALEELAQNHKRFVAYYRESGRLPNGNIH